MPYEAVIKFTVYMKKLFKGVNLEYELEEKKDGNDKNNGD